MAEKKVKVTMRAKPAQPWSARGRQVQPGEEVEVWESQAKRLLAIGVIEPYKKRTRARDKAKPERAEVPAAEDDTPATEGDTGGDTTTEGEKGS